MSRKIMNVIDQIFFSLNLSSREKSPHRRRTGRRPWVLKKEHKANDNTFDNR